MECTVLNIEAELRRLEVGYRAALSGAVVAKAGYLAQIDDSSATPASVAHARKKWRSLVQRKRAFARAMNELEAMEQPLL